jgi:competence protein ComEA
MAVAIDVNAATSEQLRDVRGIGPKTAQVIVEERSRGGPYESFSDLSDRVKGIGPKKAAALQASGLRVGSTGPGKSVLADTPGRVADPAALSASGAAKAPASRRGPTPLVRPTGK